MQLYIFPRTSHALIRRAWGFSAYVQIHLPPRRYVTTLTQEHVYEESLNDDSQKSEYRNHHDSWGNMPMLAARTKEIRPRKKSSPSKRSSKQKRVSPPFALGQWLDIETSRERAAYWHHVKSLGIGPPTLPIVLLQYLNYIDSPDGTLDADEVFINDTAITYLEYRGLTLADVKQWAWILAAEDADSMVNRFLSTSAKRPVFLVLEILRRDISKVATYKDLLVYIWNSIMPKPGQDLDVVGDITRKDDESRSIRRSTLSERTTELSFPAEDTTFLTLVVRLLNQSRRLSPPTVISVAKMVEPYLRLVFKIDDPQINLDARAHARACNLFNYIMPRLARPSAIQPMKSMVYNWDSQVVLLGLAEQIQPAIILDRNSYRSVVRILAASKKSEQEAETATLRTRTWPPWKISRNGIDAQRLSDDDMSNVITATIRMQEAGYPGGSHDQAMSILGGQETDGTPTIHTRRFIPPTLKLQNKRSTSITQSIAMNPEVWVARIIATRDIQEAWGAFNNFEKKGGEPNLAMFLAMFEKLNSEKIRESVGTTDEMIPGDGKEVLPISNDGYSAFYRSRLQPPTIDELYYQMICTGLRPGGACLRFLVAHARTPSEGMQRLKDSNIDRNALAYLQGINFYMDPAQVLQLVDTRVFSAFIELLCRFAPHAEVMTAEVDSGIAALNWSSRLSSVVIDSRDMRTYHRRNPLLHAVDLLIKTRIKYRPPWYMLFRALGRRGIIVDHDEGEGPENDLLAWRVLQVALDDFHRCGLELDPRGFQLICIGLEKAVLASIRESRYDAPPLLDGSMIIRQEFQKLSASHDSDHPIPRLMHTISAAHLHAYVRVLGLLDELEEMCEVLYWMHEHQRALEEAALQANNEVRLLRRLLVAMRLFLRDTDLEMEACRLVETVESWGGWPTDDEIQEYLAHWAETMPDGELPDLGLRGGRRVRN